MAGRIVAMRAAKVDTYSSSRRAPGIASHTYMSSSRVSPVAKLPAAPRDLLRRDAEARSRYEAIKLKLAQQYPTDRGSYTTGKAEVVASLLGGGV
jgi:GrpB-like predicted nucleotidyltransferase (UPF0157 family)